jgi:two-component system chemotaxis sensor kinase CheA
MSEIEASGELLRIYLEDARSQLDALDTCLLELERSGGPEAIGRVLGPLHTLKGNSGMLGFSGVREYVHALESALGALSRGELAPGQALYDTLFAGASALRDAVERACAAGREQRDLGRDKTALEALAAGAVPPATPAAGPAEPTAQRPASAAPELTASAPSGLVRVDFEQLDELLNLVGELVIQRTKLAEVGQRLSEASPQAAGRARELAEALRQVAAVGARLQDTVMDLRMLPLRHVFERFPRLLRDLARREGKQVELLLEGEGTRVDKAIIDQLGEPLVHMLSNAVGHGIEPPEVRVARGKPPAGTLMLSAAQESSHIVVALTDDGAGIDVDQVRRKALERGILKPEQSLPDREAVHLIFAPGFSTSEAVTDVSGRGVGLDVVLQSIERMNGLIEVETALGVGTRFTIRLPLTLAIVEALLVDVRGQTYAVPLSSVVESLALRRRDAHAVGGREVLRVRERLVPLLPLADLLHVSGPSDPERQFVVILGRGEKRLGIVVDRLRGHQQVVIKALDAALGSRGSAFAGATILGDGRVVLILDVAALFDTRRYGLEPAPAALAAPA